MLVELCLYFELLVYLVGTFLYWFLVRELWRRPQVLPGNWPLRALLVGLALWYALTLLDEILVMLVGERPDLAAVGVGIDLARGWAWLAPSRSSSTPWSACCARRTSACGKASGGGCRCRRGDGVTFTTANPGSPAAGSPAAATERLFEPFVSAGGTGLGLALVQRRCEELGARVSMDVEAGRVVFRVTTTAKAGGPLGDVAP